VSANGSNIADVSETSCCALLTFANFPTQEFTFSDLDRPRKRDRTIMSTTPTDTVEQRLVSQLIPRRGDLPAALIQTIGRPYLECYCCGYEEKPITC
jgi:hypothetical protein